jgi:hypothetical protein
MDKDQVIDSLFPDESGDFIMRGIWDIPDYEYNDLDLERPEDEE